MKVYADPKIKEAKANYVLRIYSKNANKDNASLNIRSDLETDELKRYIADHLCFNEYHEAALKMVRESVSNAAHNLKVLKERREDLAEQLETSGECEALRARYEEVNRLFMEMKT